ncbi:sulfur carrier protein ThiS [Belliella kenyensis]|uniref:Sulfur carrier protein ThiS n=1 Tax=Belliella kenyensis TaxID=1472724 RepID=A0ABV8EN33_9BACT|nr:sulfur carrier protein ThiS [Belliella kenyensis]MCH7403392.1 sulfur carrier protein ThiS [Belliella kenyensis]MDN3601604.1 sulfur carrier protein ThiS [Belliella kenyensis]
MDFTVNSEAVHISETCTITQLLQDHLNQSPKGIAIAINQTVIPKNEWDNTAISAGDNIILIKATQGG